MDKNKINQSTVRFLKGRYKKLSTKEIMKLAYKITKKYLMENQERLEKDAKLDKVLFEEAIYKEFLSVKILGAI
ncbi:hypothetical protein [Sediminicola arcticus]|uniref:Uncharacterized protein n=1 Tax=Sediminicola arcticus TaxID=1574308 RepID=A0ABV2SRM5_9FLAO